MEEQGWWQRPCRMVQANTFESQGDVDAQAMVRDAVLFHANVLRVNAGGIVAFYPTAIPYHHRSPNLRGDWLGDVVGAAKPAGLRLVVRYDLSKLHADAYHDHPEWFYADEAGAPIIDTGLYSTCLNGPWYQEWFYRLLDELFDRYPGQIDGVTFNAFNHPGRDRAGREHGPCHCLNCRRLFTEASDLPLPRRGAGEAEALRAHGAFMAAQFSGTIAAYYAYVKQHGGPDVAVFFRPRPSELMARVVDLGISEVTGAPLAAWPYWPGETCKLVHGHVSAGPSSHRPRSVINMDYPISGAWRHNCHSAGELAFGLAQAVAHGGWPFVMFCGTLDQQDTKGLEAIRSVFRFAGEHEDSYRDLESAAAVALVRPASMSEGGSAEATTMKEFRGWYRFLARQHVPFDTPPATALIHLAARDGAPAPYRLIILPDCATLDEPSWQMLNAYVVAGGVLVASGPPPEAALASCLGVQRVGERQEHPRNSHLQLTPGLAPRLVKHAHYLPFTGGYWPVDAAMDAETAFLVLPAREVGPPEVSDRDLTGAAAGPGLLLRRPRPGADRRSAPGAAAYLPWEPGRMLYERGWDDVSLLLRGLLDHVAPEALLVETDVPPRVEVTLHRQTVDGTTRLVLQLVNGTGLDGAAFDPPVPLRDLRLRLRAPEGMKFSRVWSANAGIGAQAPPSGAPLPLAMVQDRGWCEVTLPRLDLLGMVVFE